MIRSVSFTVCAWLAVGAAAADWPTLRGDVQRTGFVHATLRAPFRLAWVRHFEGERLGTAMEPIVGDHRVFVATHAGNLYALRAQSGMALWRFHAAGPFLQSPAFAAGLVIAAGVDGRVYAVDADNGQLRWDFEGDRGGFSASPLIVGTRVFVGSRAGVFFSLDLKTGRLHWRQPVGAPIRQSAAAEGGRVFVTDESLRVWCFDAVTGRVAWTSSQLQGQSARDYYPVVAKAGGRSYVVIRTNPALNMGQQIARDRHILCAGVGVDDHDWRKLDAWTRSARADGEPALWSKEQAAIIRYEQEHPEAQTCFTLDAATGKQTAVAPVLWAAGCQGVPAPPVALPDGRMLTFYRTAYGHWSFGVAPLVALGLFDRSQNRIGLLTFSDGVQPPWNTFWGTADESQNLVVADDLALIVHQGTLSGFDLRTHRLFPIRGERDTFGGFRNLPWALNEWHGPARGGVAIADNRVLWLDGSRLLCLVPNEPSTTAEDVAVDGASVPTIRGPKPSTLSRGDLRRLLADAVREVLSRRWAPLYVEPGLAGREFFFANNADLFQALALAYPHVPSDLQGRILLRLADEWAQRPPYTNSAWLPLKEGTRRERFPVPVEALTRLGQDQSPHRFGNLYAIGLYARRCHERARVLHDWPQLKATFDDFLKTGWHLDNRKGDLYANRYLASLQAFARLAEQAGDEAAARAAADKAAATSDALVSWWERAALQTSLGTFRGSAQLDSFINRGDMLFFRIAPHRHKLALWRDLTPGIAELLREHAAAACGRIWDRFVALCPTWPLAGEERQVHSGENFIDSPDFALEAFKARAWLTDASTADLARDIDLPFCSADLDYLTKLAVALEHR